MPNGREAGKQLHTGRTAMRTIGAEQVKQILTGEDATR